MKLLSAKNKLKKMKNKIAFKMQLEKFFKEQLWVYLIVLSTVVFCAWLFDKWIEGAMVIISHTCIRNAFDKQFHFNKTAYCLTLTLCIVWFAIPVSLPVTTSLLSSIPISFLIGFIGFIAQDRVDVRKDIKELEKYVLELVRKINHKDIYAMSEDELYEHCRNCGLSEDDCKLAYFVVIERLQGKELYQALPYYAPITVKRKRAKIMAKIKEQPKDITKVIK